MINMIEIILSGIIAGLTPILGIYLLQKLGFFDQIIQENIGIFINEAVNDENLQKQLYFIGGILGSGIGKGVGIQKGSGKFGFKDIAMQIAAQWAQKTFVDQPETKSKGRLP